MKFFKLSKNHLPPILFTYVGAFMLIATCVKCLSNLYINYIDCQGRSYHSDHVQNEQNHFGTSILLGVDKKDREHRFSYRTYDLQKVEDLKYIFDKHSFRHMNPLLNFSILKYR